jgi:hypothetical protein
MLGTTLTLRSKTVDGVYQEVWGTLIAYNLIRLEIAKAALVVKCELTEVSFPRFFVCQQVFFMLPVFPDVAH